jgi:hypothetical protein
VRGLLRLYVPPLPRSVFTLQAGGLVNAFGNGMVVPFMFIYLGMGRYMALNVLSWNIGFTLGPALGGLGLSVSPTGVWIAASALCAVGAGAALAIEGTLPLRARRTPLLAPSSA